MNDFIFKYDFTKEEYIKYRSLVNWISLSDEQVDNIIKNSNYKLAIYKNDELLGIARCISDDGYLYLLCDVMINPNAQGMGVGRALLNHFIEYLKNKIDNKYAKIYIMSLKGKEGFYNKLGFTDNIATGLTIECEVE